MLIVVEFLILLGSKFQFSGTLLFEESPLYLYCIFDGVAVCLVNPTFCNIYWNEPGVAVCQIFS